MHVLYTLIPLTCTHACAPPTYRHAHADACTRSYTPPACTRAQGRLRSGRPQVSGQARPAAGRVGSTWSWAVSLQAAGPPEASEPRVWSGIFRQPLLWWGQCEREARGQGSAGGCRGLWARGPVKMEGVEALEMDVRAEWTDSLAGQGTGTGTGTGWLEPPGVQRAVQGATGTGGGCVICVVLWRPCAGLGRCPPFSTLPAPPRAVGWTWARLAQVSATRWYVLGFEPRAQGPGDRYTQNTTPLGMGVLVLCDRGLRPGWSTRGCFCPYSLRRPVLAPLKCSPQEVCDTRHELQGQWPVRGASPGE